MKTSKLNMSSRICTDDDSTADGWTERSPKAGNKTR